MSIKRQTKDFYRPNNGERPHKEELVQEIVHKIMKENVTRYDIVTWLQDPDGYNFGKTYIWEVMKEASEYITELYKETAAHTLDDCLASLNGQLNAALKRGEHRLAFDIQREINKVTGKYKERIELTGDIIFKTKWGS